MKIDSLEPVLVKKQIEELVELRQSRERKDKAYLGITASTMGRNLNQINNNNDNQDLVSIGVEDNANCDNKVQRRAATGGYSKRVKAP